LVVSRLRLFIDGRDLELMWREKIEQEKAISVA